LVVLSLLIASFTTWIIISLFSERSYATTPHGYDIVAIKAKFKSILVVRRFLWYYNRSQSDSEAVAMTKSGDRTALGIVQIVQALESTADLRPAW
jgi:outer membrane protein assembly factor BamE (lipoprotein component of BamABCDE complex)